MEEEAIGLWAALAHSYGTFSKAVGTRVNEYGLTAPQFAVVDALHQAGPLSLGELAERLLVTGGNITYVMDRLEEQGLVCRKRSERDRRVVRAHLTEAGEELVAAIFPGHKRYMRGLVEHLSESERAELRKLLKKLGKGLAGKELGGAVTRR